MKCSNRQDVERPVTRLSQAGEVAAHKRHLHSSLLEFFSAAALIGLIASQAEEPDRKWACEWAFSMGRVMASEAMKLRRTRRKAR